MTRPSRPIVIGAAGAAALSLALAPMAHAAGGAARVAADGSVTGEAPANRYETAVGVSKLGFPGDGSAAAVVLARSDDFADALAGGPLAAAKDAPLLLTQSGLLPAVTGDELERVLPDEGGQVYVLGGTNAVSDDVVTAVEDLGHEVTRIQGDDRYATALAIAAEIGSEGPVLLGTGTNFPDALTAGAAAGSEGGVVLLTNGDRLPGAVADHLSTFEGDVYAIGGPAVSASESLDGVVDIEGADRYETAVGVAEEFFYENLADVNGFVLASGEDFPDALAGGASSARGNDPVLLTQQDNLPSATTTYLEEQTAQTTLLGFVVGGPNAVSDDVITATNAALNPQQLAAQPGPPHPPVPGPPTESN